MRAQEGTGQTVPLQIDDALRLPLARTLLPPYDCHERHCENRHTRTHPALWQSLAQHTQSLAEWRVQWIAHCCVRSTLLFGSAAGSNREGLKRCRTVSGFRSIE